jgi:F0F1-type ATP synthase membrane subunit a
MDIIPPAPVEVELFGLPLRLNVVTLFNSWVVIGVLLLLAWAATRKLDLVPGRLQALCEMITEFFEDVCVSTLGEKYGRKYLPFIATIFMFVLIGNWIGSLPGLTSPTQDLNTPLGLTLIVVIVMHVSAIRVNGVKGWLWSFYEPSFPGDRLSTKIVGAASFAGGCVLYYFLLRSYITGWTTMSLGARIGLGVLIGLFFLNLLGVTVIAFQMGRVPNVLMAPLNFVGELGKAISHPFRLFGNMFGGFVILSVVGSLILQIGLPPLMNAFFGLFIGLIQAFVYAMLALAYIAVMITEE